MSISDRLDQIEYIPGQLDTAERIREAIAAALGEASRD